MMNRVKVKRHKQRKCILKPSSLRWNHPIHEPNGIRAPHLKWMSTTLSRHRLGPEQVLLCHNFPSSLKPKAPIMSLEEVYIVEAKGLWVTPKTLILPNSKLLVFPNVPHGIPPRASKNVYINNLQNLGKIQFWIFNNFHHFPDSII